MGRNHLRTLEADPRFNLVALVEPRSDTVAADLRTKYLVLEDYHGLAGVDFDAAVVATPTETHYEVTHFLLSAGKHVLVEKPAAVTLAQTEKLILLASERAVRFCVGHIERCNPAVAKLAEIIRSGGLGRPLFATAIRAGGFPQHVNPGNDVILDLGIHELDVLNSVFGPVTIVGGMAQAIKQAGVADVADAWLEGREGFRATIHVDWHTPTRLRMLRVVGESGTIELDYRAQTVSLGGAPPVKAEPVEPLRVQLGRFYEFVTRGVTAGLCAGDEMAQSVRLAREWLHRATAAGRPESQRG